MEGPFVTSNLDLGTELDNPVWRDLKLIRRPQGVTLQQQDTACRAGADTTAVCR